jgi:hypothetical protein
MAALGTQNPALAYQATDPTAANYVAPTSSFGTVPGTAPVPGSSYSTPANPSAFSSFTTGANQFLTSPVGQVATFGGVGAIGALEAHQANQEASKLAGSISTLGQPYSQAGAAQLGQLTGGPQAPGPMGTQTALATTAANELGQVAVQYGTGNLTPAQNTQVQSFVSQQRAQVDSTLGASGNIDSSARAAAYQQIDNNAAMLAQQLEQGNINMAQGALQAMQSSYSNLLTQALNSSAFGLGAQSQAVSLLMQSNTQVAGQLQQLFSALAQGLGTAWGGGKGTGGTAGTGGNAVQNILKGLGGGGGNVTVGNNPQQWTANDPNNPSTTFPAAGSLPTPLVTGLQTASGAPGGMSLSDYGSNLAAQNFGLDTTTGTVDVGIPSDTGAVSFGTGD